MTDAGAKTSAWDADAKMIAVNGQSLTYDAPGPHGLAPFPGPMRQTGAILARGFCPRRAGILPPPAAPTIPAAVAPKAN
ncbi:MAG: hypothetical protein ACRD2E_07910 [Terriglobales bacterium]